LFKVLIPWKTELIIDYRTTITGWYWSCTQRTNPSQ
jgi:hypothetical protein